MSVEEKGALEMVKEVIATVDYHLTALKAMLDAISSGKPLEKDRIENEFFIAKILYIPLGDGYLNAIFNITPKINVPQDLLKLIYVSEIFLKDESSILKAISSGSWEKLSKGTTISFSIVVNKDVKDWTIRSILAKLSRAFRAFSNDQMRKKLLHEKKQLESLAKNPSKKAREIILTVMKINEYLFYES